MRKKVGQAAVTENGRSDPRWGGLGFLSDPRWGRIGMKADPPLFKTTRPSRMKQPVYKAIWKSLNKENIKEPRNEITL